MEHNAREIAVAFPAHLREMFNQTVSAKLAFWEPHIRQVTKEGKTYKVASKKDSWLVLTYKDLHPCCVEAIKEFVRKMDGRFVLFARVGADGDVENIVGKYTPSFFEAKGPDPLDPFGDAGIWYGVSGLGL